MEKIINRGQYCKFNLNINNSEYIIDTIYDDSDILYVKYTNSDNSISAVYDNTNILYYESTYNFHISVIKDDKLKEGLFILHDIIDYIKNNFIKN